MAKITAAWGTVRAGLQNLNSYEIKRVVGLAGLDVLELAALRQEDGVSKGQLMSAIDGLLGQEDVETQRHAVAIVVEELLQKNPALSESMEPGLARHGWGLAGNTLVPLELFDLTEIAALPDAVQVDLVKAAQRFRDGDLGGAISAACGAVDTAVAAVYLRYGLGDHTDATFQEGCNKALAAVVDHEDALRAFGWDEGTLKQFLGNFKGALSQGAFVMQTLRSRMGDVHGTKPILKALVFDAIKWAELFVRRLSVP
ncbi:hypothetical protein CFM90_26530 (plasmid) [Ralstonia solanacearum]|nr:hypothetical protein CFM90_26530 [Ralstonia solanacearum]